MAEEGYEVVCAADLIVGDVFYDPTLGCLFEVRSMIVPSEANGLQAKCFYGKCFGELWFYGYGRTVIKVGSLRLPRYN